MIEANESELLEIFKVLDGEVELGARQVQAGGSIAHHGLQGGLDVNNNKVTLLHSTGSVLLEVHFVVMVLFYPFEVDLLKLGGEAFVVGEEQPLELKILQLIQLLQFFLEFLHELDAQIRPTRDQIHLNLLVMLVSILQLGRRIIYLLDIVGADGLPNVRGFLADHME